MKATQAFAPLVFSFSLFGLMSNATFAQQTPINVIDAIEPADSATGDDTNNIQAAINTAITSGINRVRLKAGKTYHLNRANTQNALIIWSSGLTLEGNNAVLVDNKAISDVGYWGETIGINGLINGNNYPVEAGTYTINGQTITFNTSGTLTSSNVQIKNVTVQNLTISHQTNVPLLNSVGITFADHVTLKNITINDSPQTSVAVVADSSALPVSDVYLENVVSNRSKYHAFRISLQNSADTLSVRMNKCAVNQVQNAETVSSAGDTDVVGRKAAVWYRAASDSDNIRLTIENSSFDQSAEIVASQGAKNLSLIHNDIWGGVSLIGHTGTSVRSNILLAENVFQCSYAKKYHSTTEAPIYISGHYHGVLFRNRISGDSAPWLMLSNNVDVLDVSHYWGTEN